MKKHFAFTINEYQVNIAHSAIVGSKLYVDSLMKDRVHGLWLLGGTRTLKAKLSEYIYVEVVVITTLLTVNIEAFLISNRCKQLVYSSL